MVRLAAECLEKSWDARGRVPVSVVRGVSLAVEAGESLAIVGPSGSGKTTLLAMLGGLLQPDRGRVLIDGRDLRHGGEGEQERRRARDIAFVFQRGLLVDYLTARENVALVARAAGTARSAALRHATGLLERLGLGDRLDSFAAALSPGEAQRVAVARALINGPCLVLADEPTAHLDRAAGAAVVAALRELCADRGAALVLVTHDTRLSAAVDRTLPLDDGRLGPA